MELVRSGWILRGEFKVGIHGLDVVPEGAEKQREDWRLTSGSQIGWAMTVLSELGRLWKEALGWLGMGVHYRIQHVKVERWARHLSGNVK